MTSSGTPFPNPDSMAGGMDRSHHGDKPDNIANYAEMNRYHVQNLADFAKAKQDSEGDGTSGSRADLQRKQHGQFPSPCARKVPVSSLAKSTERSKGTVTSYFRTSKATPIPRKTTNMLLSILHLFGIDQETFGASTGPLPIA